MDSSLWSIRANAALLLCFAVAGCSRPPELVFVAATDELPGTHQEQIAGMLRELFGTPANPRFAVPSGQSDADGNAEYVDFVDAQRLKHGATVFNRRCAGCHGVTGDGSGEAAEYLQPKPRDYRRGIYKFTSTPYGAKPHRADLVRVIRYGAKGTSMPAFRFLPDEDLQDLVHYVTMLSYRGEVEQRVATIASIDYEADEEIDPFEFTDALTAIHNSWQQAEYQAVLPVTAQPKYDDSTILAGRKAFLSKGCSKCHGDDFRGQTEWLSHEFLDAQLAKPEAEREQINFDAWGEPGPAADLTARMLHGGRRPIDIYRRVFTGINGTPMPAFQNALAEEPETVWHLVHYVLSVVDGREVEGLADVVADPPATDASNED